LANKRGAKTRLRKSSARADVRADELSQQEAAEGRTAEAATVAWMLCLMATVLAELSGVGIRLLMLTGNRSAFLPVISSVMLFTALVAGTLTLVLTLLVKRLRKRPVPAPIVVAAVAIGAVPIVACILLAVAPR
jgi:hypothetical protein